MGSLFLGDEAYEPQQGYYSLRRHPSADIFERGGEKNWKKTNLVPRTDCRDAEKTMDEVYLCEYLRLEPTAAQLRWSA